MFVYMYCFLTNRVHNRLNFSLKNILLWLFKKCRVNSIMNSISLSSSINHQLSIILVVFLPFIPLVCSQGERTNISKANLRHRTLSLQYFVLCYLIIYACLLIFLSCFWITPGLCPGDVIKVHLLVALCFAWCWMCWSQGSCRRPPFWYDIHVSVTSRTRAVLLLPTYLRVRWKAGHLLYDYI